MCRKSTTRDPWLYFPSEGRHTQDFYALKIHRPWLGLNPRTSDPEASMITTGPPGSMSSHSCSWFIDLQRPKCNFHPDTDLTQHLGKCDGTTILEVHHLKQKNHLYEPNQQWLGTWLNCVVNDIDSLLSSLTSE